MDQINTEVRVPKRILNTLITSLAAGVVPRIGAPYIAIGREEELGSLLGNLDDVAEGGAACRFLIGRYGSGKSFLIQLIRGRALERGFICADADLSPERRLTGGSGAGLATYKELMTNIAIKASPDGGALPTILSRYYANLQAELAVEGITPDSPVYEDALKRRVIRMLAELEGDVGGFDFARVLGEYYSALIGDDIDKKSACLRWLRGEFSNKTEANSALGFRVSCVIDDDNWYGFIKLFASLSVKLGYSGFIVFIDECVNLYKIPNRISREANYEKLLAIFNDTLQGKAKSLGVIFGGTPQFLEDTRRGLFSYDALKSRLADSKYDALSGYRNLSSPVIRLRTLSGSELLALVKRLTNLYAMKEGTPAPVTDSEIEEFVRAARSRAGADEMLTPREIIRDYLSFLNILRDNKSASFSELIRSMGNEYAESLASDIASDSEERETTRKKVNLFDIDI
ncbi:MAG: biotin carboxylase [Ruminococcaceae bacterium]|nr:biotin carboxylase [Oscillospiraceae bacterium]